MNHLEKFAQRLEADEFFLAGSLGLYAQTEGLDDRLLAERLGCSPSDLVRLRICRAPSNEAGFQRDIDTIAERFGINRDVLAEAVRRGQVIAKMRATAMGQQGLLMAARDREKPIDEAEGETT